jgi:transposase InsO family protein
MALARRRPPQGLLHHSDRGSQYASDDYQRLLAAHGIVGSMSRRGDCWDNAVAESFFATLKVELVHDATWPTRAVARDELFEYMERYYNGQRRHSSLGYVSPLAFERRRGDVPTLVELRESSSGRQKIVSRRAVTVNTHQCHQCWLTKYHLRMVRIGLRVGFWEY